ncbi:MAG: epoxyqueuosine reductase QueH [candidate division Zixibacteria bacterium]|nr:epoxyqueuosine reductase QueH [candidate division Zixibacteria bacterium]
MEILIHICCGPCLTYPLKRLTEKGHTLTGFWYNPNIHPYTEYQNRLEAARYLEWSKVFPMIYEDFYDLEGFLKEILPHLEDRCRFCYQLRLGRTARVAREKGFEAFSTTLLVSPTQKHEIINEIGEKLAEEYKIKFFYEDLRPGYYEGKNLAKEMNLYRQKYCGCIFSEKERYYKESSNAQKLKG